ncbi:MAG: helix-turn-helix transcriptional regulator [Acidimicrobiales bacterium]
MAGIRDTTSLDERLASIGSLQEPVRRALYLYIAGERDDVSRDQAAEAVGIQRSLAAFHLDKLVDAGLLQTTFRRLTGRTGPGAGRPAKLYRRSSSEHTVSLPPRQYDLAAELLAEAVEEAGDRPARATLVEVARRFGRRVGAELRATQAPRASRERRLAAVIEELERYGYEPRREGRVVRLGNCPFHALAESHRDLVCGMNHALLEGVADGVDGGALEARSDPKPGECCVTVAVRRKA